MGFWLMGLLATTSTARSKREVLSFDQVFAAMSPQPVNRIRPDTKVDFDPSKLANKPHLIALPMTVIATWATIDSIIAELLAYLIKSDLAVAVAMFHAIKNQDAQRQAVLAAAEKTLTPDDHKLLSAIWKASKASRDRRHEYAHHLWGIPDNIPDALALMDPKDSLRERVAFEEQMNAWRKQMRRWTATPTTFLHYHQHQSPTPPPDAPNYSNVQCFRKSDLDDDVTAAQKALQWFLDFRRALFDPSQQVRDEARRRLLAAPQIQQSFQPPSSGTLFSQTEPQPGLDQTP